MTGSTYFRLHYTLGKNPTPRLWARYSLEETRARSYRRLRKLDEHKEKGIKFIDPDKA